MPTFHHGRHEHGQNFLTHRPTIAAMLDLARATTGPVVEIGPGDGALTVELSRLGRPLTAVEIDARAVARLERRLPPEVRVACADFLAYRLPSEPHVLVGNLPFHLTTAILRRILHAPGWTDAVLMTQWEVARRRAGVGGSSMMTAQWAPWVTFTLQRRVPAEAFTPRPAVDGGIITMRRNPEPAVPTSARVAYQALVHRVFTGPGRGLGQILPRATGLGTGQVRVWLRRNDLRTGDLPRAVGTAAWIDLFRTTGTSPPRRRRAPRHRDDDCRNNGVARSD